MPASAQDTLDKILAELRHPDPTRQLLGIQELLALDFSSPVILMELEKLALRSERDDVRKAALQALDTPTQRLIRSRTNKLRSSERKAILKEIEDWVGKDLINESEAVVLRTRYNFDSIPAPISKSSKAETREEKPGEKGQAASPQPRSTGPRPSLTQTLLSETSIKIALYLGAFFVISAAIILAALVEAARLPILFTATFIFGGAALAIRKRLPQPSFALFIVFSFLLPITANVIEETLNLEGWVNSTYWFFVSLGMAAVWFYSTWLYSSRLFSIAAFLSLNSAFFNIGDFLTELTKLTEPQPEYYLPFLSIASLLGLAVVHLLKNWKEKSFALPLFILDHFQQLGLILISAILVLVRLSEPEPIGVFWLAYSLVFIVATAFYIWSNSLISFVLFPWFAAATAIPIASLSLQVFEPRSTLSIAVLMLWGMILGITSDVAYRFNPARRYSTPVLIASAPLFLTGSIWGLSENVWYGFTCLLIVFFSFGVLHALRPKTWLWAASLLAGATAYFIFFELPFMENIHIFYGYKFFGLTLSLLLPDLLLKANFQEHPSWRLPLRLFGFSFAIINLISMLGNDEPMHAAIVYLLNTILFVVYAVKYRQAWIAYFSTAALVLAVLFLLSYYHLDSWLPVLTTLAAIYFVTGMILRTRMDWSDVMRISGLTLGSLAILWSLISIEVSGGWYALLVASLFLVEFYVYRVGWLEVFPPVFLSMATFMILREYHIEEQAYILAVITLIWLGSDLLFYKSFKGNRPLARTTRSLGGLLLVMSTIILLSPELSSARTAWICLAAYTVFLAFQSIIYQRPALNYLPAAYLPLTTLFVLQDLDQAKWLVPLILISVIYYGSGRFLNRNNKETEWGQTLVNSGLALGTLTSISAPFQGGLDASIPVALAATLWATEAFARKNVWLGFPANALYLMAYFMILVELNVEEPQFFSTGAALLGMIMHYLLVRSGSKSGAFLTGMVSQLILLGTTYLQMLSTGKLSFFIVLFLQSMVVLMYGIIIRSRSLVFTPILFSVLGVVTVIYSALKGTRTVILIGCTGILLLSLGILAVVLRERLARLGERLNDWQA